MDDKWWNHLDTLSWQKFDKMDSPVGMRLSSIEIFPTINNFGKSFIWIIFARIAPAKNNHQLVHSILAWKHRYANMATHYYVIIRLIVKNFVQNSTRDQIHGLKEDCPSRHGLYILAGTCSLKQLNINIIFTLTWCWFCKSHFKENAKDSKSSYMSWKVLLFHSFLVFKLKISWF